MPLQVLKRANQSNKSNFVAEVAVLEADVILEDVASEAGVVLEAAALEADVISEADAASEGVALEDAISRLALERV